MKGTSVKKPMVTKKETDKRWRIFADDKMTEGPVPIVQPHENAMWREALEQSEHQLRMRKRFGVRAPQLEKW